jgi:outer membrane protein assembly factor BamA
LYFKLKYLLFFIGIVVYTNSVAQNINLKILSTRSKSEVTKLNYKKKFNNKSGAINEIDQILKTLQYRGFLLASADSIFSDSLTVTAIISENEQYNVAYLGLGNLDQNLASKLGISEKLYFNKPFRYKEVASGIEKILNYYENNGYPFASVKIDSVSSENTELRGVFNVSKNKFFKIDSIQIVGTATVNTGFLYRYLGIKENMPYKEQVIKGISTKIKQLPFVTEKQGQIVRLTDRTNKLILFLDKRNASQFDGIVGLLPDADTKKTIITGDLKLKLVNSIFRNGETFDLEWRRLRSLTQDFNGKFIYPYLFGTPLGADYGLKIYRRDTTFIDINNVVAGQFYFSGLNNFRVFYKQRNSNLISTAGLGFVSILPEYADISTSSYGAGVFIEKLDYRFNPKKGFVFNLSAQTGNRNIRQNPKINELAYRNLMLKSIQYQIEANVSGYLNVYRNQVLMLGLQHASVFGNSGIFTNELFRIGGFKTLRGFDEESIFASLYFIPTLEYRLLFAQNSYALLFAEGAWYENNSNRAYISDTPLSFGAGINFETKAGILSINYALGNQFNNGFDLRNGKIHFGLKALF